MGLSCQTQSKQATLSANTHTHPHTNDCTKWMPQQAVIHLFIYICMYVCACVAHEMHFTTITCALRCFIFLYIYPLFFMRSNTFYLHRYHLCCHAALVTYAFFICAALFHLFHFQSRHAQHLQHWTQNFYSDWTSNGFNYTHYTHTHTHT